MALLKVHIGRFVLAIAVSMLVVGFVAGRTFPGSGVILEDGTAISGTVKLYYSGLQEEHYHVGSMAYVCISKTTTQK